MKSKARSRIALGFTIALMLAVVGTAAATDYYVSSTAAGRSDSNAGTSSTAPWATFTKVMNSWGTTIKAGDTVHLQKGSTFTVSSRWTIRAGGSAAGGYMTIRGDDYGTGAKPRVRRTASSGDAFFDIKAGGYLTLRSFVIDGGSDLGLDAGGIIVGSSDQAASIRNINILDMTLENLASGAVYCSGIHLVPHNGYPVTDCLIEGNDISGFTTWGLNHYQDKVLVKTQSLLNNITWRNNRIHDPSLNRWPNVNGGMHAMSGGSNNVFEYNYVEGDYEMGSFVLSNCINDEKDLRVRYNVLKDNTMGFGIQICEDTEGAPNCVLQASFYGNIVTGCRLSAFSMGSENYFSGVFNVYNNTFYDNHQDASYPSWGAPQNGGEIWAGSNNPRLTAHFRNNIVVHTAVGGNTRVCLSLNGFDGTITHANNLYWHTSGGSAAAIYNNGTTYTVSQALTYESTGRNSDPLLTNPADTPTAVSSAIGVTDGGFKPMAGSPAVDHGVDLGSSFAGSIDNVLRPQGGAWDIGAYEVGAAGPIPVAAPSLLSATATASTAIRLNWQDNSTDETAFRVERGTTSSTFAHLITLGAGTTVYSDTGLAPLATRYYRVRAERGTNVSAFKSVAQATTLAGADTIRPAVAWVSASVDPTRVIVAFSEPVTAATASNVANYGVSGSLRVTAALAAQSAVTLSLAPSLADQRAYTLTVSNILDTAGNAIASGTRTSFMYQAVSPAMIVWYPFENGTADQSGHANHGTAFGAAVTTTGRLGRAYSFDSADDYIQAPWTGSSPTRGAIALWIRPSGFRASSQYIVGHTSQTDWANRIQVYTDETGGILNLGLGDQHALLTGIATLVARQWQHVALTWDATTYRVYVDGTERANGTFTGFTALNTFVDIGNTGNSASRGEGFSGEIDDVRMFNRALDPTEVKLLASPVAVPLPPSQPLMGP
jgi:hypothetical protein